MKNHRIFTKTWFRVAGISLVLGAALLAMLLFNLPASAYPPEPTVTPSVDVDEGDRESIHIMDVKLLEGEVGALTPPPCALTA